ncbi:hypothetical protein NUM_06160 [Actinocatenispora comari]|uniref:Uncharacterized protein n=2 Tax=Actinocatenispora comari TaxID=2807577 RepID=A0A8J4A5D6_9ACTN|nr:hypothetical protein NUM_06160 [Actinocatenispora comari]
MPATLAAAWPKARVDTVPGLLPTGDTYQMAAVLDDGATVGIASRPQRPGSRLVVVSHRNVRVLASITQAGVPGFTAIATDAARVYWAATVDVAGSARTSLWWASRRGGAAHRLVADAGPATFNQSQYDLQVSGGRLRWVDANSARSVPVTGGAVAVRPIPAGYTPLAWPWFTSPAGLYDAAAQVRTSVRVGPGATCGRAWCRVSRRGELDLLRPDGSDRHRLGGGSAAAALVDVTPLDRFEVVSVAAPAGASGPPLSELLLYDIRRRRSVELAATAASVHARAGYLWWSTVVAGTSSWHLLNLRNLG